MNRQKANDMGGVALAMALATATCLIAGDASAKEPSAQNWYRVNVHMSTTVAIPFLGESQAAAATILGTIGVKLTWTRDPQASNGALACEGESTTRNIAVEIVPHAPAKSSDAAVAIAFPYAEDGVRIVIFYDRVVILRDQAPQMKILGYVLAHEIGHVLQGIARHSQTGVMSAHWTENDFKQMSRGTLTFTPEDTQSIRRTFAAHPGRVDCSQSLNAQTITRPLEF
jgi:hypothetical protein